MKKLLIPVICLLGLVLPGCGGSSSSSAKTSGITYRAFLSDDVSAGSSASGVYIVNAADDVRYNGAPIAAGNTPGMMVLTPNRANTLVFSGNNTPNADNDFSIITNATETNSAHVTLPGYTQSIVVSPDSSTAYVAMPTFPVAGNQSPGAIDLINMAGAVIGEVDIPSVQYLALNNDGSRLLAFSSNSDSIAIVTPSNIGTGNQVVTYVGGFDRPVAAFFSSDDTVAYVLNCGAECSGTQASVQQLDMTTGTAGTPSGVCALDSNNNQQCAATVALLQGSMLYIAGTPYNSSGPSFTCLGQEGETLNCGMLTIFDLNAMAPVNTAAIAIPDGYHTVLQMGFNGQLYIGSRTCTEIVPPLPPPPGAEIRGCLAIYNTLSSAVGSNPAGGVLIPPVNGDATGIQPIANRTVVYVIQGGSLLIYDDNTDALEYNPNDPDFPGQIQGLVGQFIDVLTVDF